MPFTLAALQELEQVTAVQEAPWSGTAPGRSVVPGGVALHKEPTYNPTTLP